MVAIIAVYLASVVLLIHMARPAARLRIPQHRAWAYGFFAALLAQTIYSMSDAVTMGSKPNFFFWWLLALIAGFSNLALQGANALAKVTNSSPQRLNNLGETAE
jgi:hypothetical protein